VPSKVKAADLEHVTRVSPSEYKLICQVHAEAEVVTLELACLHSMHSELVAGLVVVPDMQVQFASCDEPVVVVVEEAEVDCEVVVCRAATDGSTCTLRLLYLWLPGYLFCF
jgi:hypothetical protein